MSRPSPPPPKPDLRAHRDGWGGLALAVGLLAAVLAVWGLPMLIVVLAVIGMIFLHEMGHFVAARAAGMKVTEFFLGFGPRLWSMRRGDTVYGLKAIPAGAYVRIIGMNNLEEVAPVDEHRTYRSKPYWRRMSVAVAGSTVHFLLALVLIFSFLVVGGRTQSVPSPDWAVSQVVSGSPAHRAGLLPGDRIVSVDDIAVANMEDMAGLLPGPGATVSLGVERGSSLLVRSLVLDVHPGDSSRGYIGIGSRSAWSSQSVDVGYLEAAGETLEEFGFLVKESVYGIARFFSPSGLSSFFRNVADQTAPDAVAPAGGGIPVAAPADAQDRVVSIFGALRIGADLTESGYGNLLLFLALLNVFIGVFNMIPLLPLDGGHVVIATYERLRSWRGNRYTADVTKMVPVAYAVILILVFVFIGSVYLDLTDPVRLPS
ncbi:MAG: M50 family metallopeptidase [bacterium]|nr:M50 family metallopeptidase [bacterium]MCY4272207.1 M50 family metallopeptidase [bacterium]